MNATADQITYKMAMDAVGLSATMLTPNSEVYADLIKQEREMHNSLHITDPTLYIKAINSRSLQHQVKLAKAALAFILAVQDVKADIGGTP